MLVKDLMTAHPAVGRIRDLAVEAAQRMRVEDTGFLPVVRDDVSFTLVGVVTDRDLCIRGYASTNHGKAKLIQDCMTPNPVTCNASDDLEYALSLMEGNQVRRLPVVDSRTKRLEGVIGLGDIVRCKMMKDEEICRAYANICRPYPIFQEIRAAA